MICVVFDFRHIDSTINRLMQMLINFAAFYVDIEIIYIILTSL